MKISGEKTQMEPERYRNLLVRPIVNWPPIVQPPESLEREAAEGDGRLRQLGVSPRRVDSGRGSSSFFLPLSSFMLVP